MMLEFSTENTIELNSNKEFMKNHFFAAIYTMIEEKYYRLSREPKNKRFTLN